MSNRIRCAIYTRKSTEEGLEQAFNSLDAQREACEAYIQSQKGLGWTVIKKHYDDGGISGGTMDRPALRELLEDIEQGRVDLIVVYKVDRLTRSLMDFSRMIEIFDAKKVSFVSVTQQFNTSSSMGRLTLNVLLSFAQFEREVTAERIRDKIAASKKKGMWMGGPVPLGYNVVDRKLIVNEGEAETVREVFCLYQRLGSVRLLKQELDRQGIVTKVRVKTNGEQVGGKPFARGNLYTLLTNPIYIGCIPHKGVSYPGEHKAIVDMAMWEDARNLLDGNAVKRRSLNNKTGPFLLTGKVFDESGAPLYQSQAHTHGKRYCYYVSRQLTQGDADASVGWRIPARTLENVAITAIANTLKNETKLIETLGLGKNDVETLRGLKDRAEVHGCQLQDDRLEEKQAVAQTIIDRVDLSSSLVTITLNRQAFARHLELIPAEDQGPITIDVPVRLQRRGVETKLIIENSQSKVRDINLELCNMVAQAHHWFDQLSSGEVATVREIATNERVNEHEITRVLHLAFLSPKIVGSIFNGRQGEEITVHRLRRLSSIPYDWTEQANLLENLD
jgi:site-specific DNA recombinase